MYLKHYMKTFFVLIFTFSSTLYAQESCVGCEQKLLELETSSSKGMNKMAHAIENSEKIMDDIRICGPIEINDFKRLVRNLKKYYNTTLEESYFKIECGDSDLFDLIVKSPRDRYSSAYRFQRYFEKEKKMPEFFSRILLNKIRGKNILRRIEMELYLIKGGRLAGGKTEKKLIKLQKKYLEYLEKYPVSQTP